MLSRISLGLPKNILKNYLDLIYIYIYNTTADLPCSEYLFTPSLSSRCPIFNRTFQTFIHINTKFTYEILFQLFHAQKSLSFKVSLIKILRSFFLQTIFLGHKSIENIPLQSSAYKTTPISQSHFYGIHIWYSTPGILLDTTSRGFFPVIKTARNLFPF